MFEAMWFLTMTVGKRSICRYIKFWTDDVTADKMKMWHSDGTKNHKIVEDGYYKRSVDS